jgi:hypothetical protein
VTEIESVFGDVQTVKGSPNHVFPEFLPPKMMCRIRCLRQCKISVRTGLLTHLSANRRVVETLRNVPRYWFSGVRPVEQETLL